MTDAAAAGANNTDSSSRGADAGPDDTATALVCSLWPATCASLDKISLKDMPAVFFVLLVLHVKPFALCLYPSDCCVYDRRFALAGRF